MIIFSKMRLNILIQCFSATTQQLKVEVHTMYIVVKNVTIYAHEDRNKGRKLDGTTSQ